MRKENFEKIIAFYGQREIDCVLGGYVSEVLGSLLKSNLHSILDYLNENEESVDLLLDHTYNMSTLNEVVKKLMFEFSDEMESSVLEIRLEKQKIESQADNLREELLRKLVAQLNEEVEPAAVENILALFEKIVTQEGKEPALKMFL